MGKDFEKLPANYQKAINEAIKDNYGDAEMEAMEAYKEWEAEALLGCELHEDKDVDIEEFADAIIAFVGGWRARVENMRLFT